MSKVNLAEMRDDGKPSRLKKRGIKGKQKNAD